MLATMLTAMYLAVRASEQLGVRWVRSEPLPYTAVHCVSQGRRSDDECGFDQKNTGGGSRRNSSTHLNKAATTIQSQYRKYQQRTQKA